MTKDYEGWMSRTASEGQKMRGRAMVFRPVRKLPWPSKWSSKRAVTHWCESKLCRTMVDLQAAGRISHALGKSWGCCRKMAPAYSVQTISTNDSMHCFITDQTPTLMFHPRVFWCMDAGYELCGWHGRDCSWLFVDLTWHAERGQLTSSILVLIRAWFETYITWHICLRAVELSMWSLRSSGRCKLEREGRIVVVCSIQILTARQKLG
jgi:hypothetical protein